MHKLAINGGEKVRSKLFPAYNTIGREEEQEVLKVLQSGSLSKFLGCWDNDFYGGAEIRRLEAEWSKYFQVKHAISVNSATSGLCCAVGAAGIGPGDEVIVTPYTMSASASAILAYNAIPVFADIEEDTYCLNVDSVREKITNRTKAIIVVDLFGQPYDAEAINALAKENGLIVIEDAAQAPGAKFKDRFAGTLGDIGVFSLNYHKHIHSGEGGMVTTNNDELAERIQLIRNHAEVVVEEKGVNNIINMLGFNYRMTEIEATIARQQLFKLKDLLNERIKNVEYLEKKLKSIECIELPKVRNQCKHSYYVHAIKFYEDIAGVSRETFVNAVKAELEPMMLREGEGVQVGCGYVKPIYLNPLYQKQIVYGKRGCPFKCGFYEGKVDYSKGICPTCESLHEKKIITHEYMRPGMSLMDLDDVAEAFLKVWENIDELKQGYR